MQLSTSERERRLRRLVTTDLTPPPPMGAADLELAATVTPLLVFSTREAYQWCVSHSETLCTPCRFRREPDSFARAHNPASTIKRVAPWRPVGWEAVMVMLIRVVNHGFETPRTDGAACRMESPRALDELRGGAPPEGASSHVSACRVGRARTVSNAPQCVRALLAGPPATKSK